MRARKVMPSAPNSSALLDWGAPAYTSARHVISKSTKPAEITAPLSSPSRRAPAIQTGPQRDVGLGVLRNSRLHENVANLQPSAWLEYPSHLRQRGDLVGHQVQRAIGHDDIRPAVLDGQRLAIPQAELDLA